MDKSELPSNKQFGVFFSIIFFVIAVYLASVQSSASYGFFIIAGVLVFSALFKPSLLTPLNRVWYKFGLLLAVITTPIVLGVFFFVLITPLALFLRLTGRDTLRLKTKKYQSNWRQEEDVINNKINFKRQF